MTKPITLTDVLVAHQNAQALLSEYIRQNIPTETLVGILIDRPECTAFHTSLADVASGITMNGTLYEGNLIALVIDRDKEVL